MSNFELSTGMMQANIDILKRTRTELDGITQNLKKQAGRLSGNSGFGINEIQTSILSRVKEVQKQSDNVKQLIQCLEYVLQETESCDKRAYRLLDNDIEPYKKVLEYVFGINTDNETSYLDEMDKIAGVGDKYLDYINKYLMMQGESKWKWSSSLGTVADVLGMAVIFRDLIVSESYADSGKYEGSRQQVMWKLVKDVYKKEINISEIKDLSSVKNAKQAVEMINANALPTLGKNALISYGYHLVDNWITAIDEEKTVGDVYMRTFGGSLLDTFEDTVCNDAALIAGYVPAKLISDTFGLDIEKKAMEATGETNALKAVINSPGVLFKEIKSNLTVDNWVSGVKSMFGRR